MTNPLNDWHWYAVPLQFITPVHLGEPRGGETLATARHTLQADTLFSAMLHALYQTGNETKAKELETAFKSTTLEGLPWLHSDAFPFFKEGNDYRLSFPKPKGSLIEVPDKGGVQESDSVEKKKLKKRSLLWDGELSALLCDADKKTLGDVFDEDACPKDLWQEETRTQVTLRDNTKEEAMPYSVGTIRFASNAGLWVAIAVNPQNHDDTVNLLNTLFKILSVEGIGGKRSNGFGRFPFQKLIPESKCSMLNEVLEEARTSENRSKLLLSTATPHESQEDAFKTGHRAYKLGLRQGFHASTDTRPEGFGGIGAVKKKPVMMVEAGSVFESSWCGSLVDVTPDDLGAVHNLYRYAHALWL